MSDLKNFYKKYFDKYYSKNLNWDKSSIAELYSYENPNWTIEQCHEMAELLYKEIKKMNRQSFRERDRFFKMNTPFSYFGDRTDEFEEVYWDRNSE